jgi:hypothetical protein
MTVTTRKKNADQDRLPPGIQTRLTALFGVLDEDIQHIEATLVRLDLLRGLLIKRDDKALEKLLEEIRTQGEAYAAAENKRQELRHEMATALGFQERDLTLSELAARVGREDGVALIERQTRLKALVARLKREHKVTALLIADCARFNRSLLHIFFGPTARTGPTYSASGVVRHPTGTAVLNMQF